MKTFVRISLAVACLGAAPDARADRIRLTDGRVFEGTVERPGDGTAVIRTEGSSVAISAALIESVAVPTPAEKAYLQARDHLRAQRWPQAADALAELALVETPSDELSELFAKHGEPLARNAASLDEARRASLATALDGLAGRGLSPEGVEGVLWLRLGLGQADEAEKLVDPQFFDSHPDRRKAIAEWVEQSIAQAVAGADARAVKAERLLAPLAKLDPAGGASRRSQFQLQWARRRLNDGDFAGALAIYSEKLFPDSPEIARDRMRSALEEAEKTYGMRNTPGPLIALLQEYGVKFVPDTARPRLVQLHRNEGWQAARAKQFDLARAAFERANAVVPGSAVHDLDQLEYRGKAERLDKADLLGWYELGIWANGRKLDDEAVEAFRAAYDSPIVGENARTYIDQIMNRRAERDLTSIMDLYDAGRFGDALDKLFEFDKETYGAGYRAQGAQIRKLTMDQMRIAISEKPQQAAALYQQAERAFYQGDAEEAADKLRVVLERYRDTPTYPQALNLFVRVREQQSLRQLEQGTAVAAIDDSATSKTEASPLGRELERIAPQ